MKKTVKLNDPAAQNTFSLGAPVGSRPLALPPPSQSPSPPRGSDQQPASAAAQATPGAGARGCAEEGLGQKAS